MTRSPQAEAPQTVHLVEDDQAVRDSLVALLQSWLYAVAAFPDGESYLAAPDRGQAACILLDLKLPGRDGLAVLSALRKAGCLAPVIVISAHGDIAMAVKALQQGAQDFIEKPFDDGDLVERIKSVACPPAGQQRQPDAPLAQLTPRETQVMHQVVAGQANKAIAHALDISQKTVEMHRARVMRKTGAKTLSHLVRIALKAGIDPDSPPS
ncbi:MAG: oxygen response regulator transcription factor FixJ [Rhodospirillales bacterium]